MNNRNQTKFISHKQSNVCLTRIKLSHKVNNVKRDHLTIIKSDYKSDNETLIVS